MQCKQSSFEIVSFKPRPKEQEQEYNAEAYKSMFDALEVIGRKTAISLSYRKGIYRSKNWGKWIVTMRGKNYTHKNVLHAVGEAVKAFCRDYNIDYEKELSAQEGGTDV